VKAGRAYLLSLPERAARTLVGLTAGAIRELGELVVPGRVRRSQLYDNLVGTTLRYLIEQVGGVEGVYVADGQVGADFMVRRTAGNAIELLGIVAFRASPVWVLAALADLCGAGRQLIPEIADALKAEGLLEPDAEFTSVDQMLDGLEHTSGRLAAAVNTPPLDVAGLREEWRALSAHARTIPPARLPQAGALRDLWGAVVDEAQRQERSVFEVSSMAALGAAGRVPDGLRWLSASALTAAGRTGRVVAAGLLEDYRQTLAGMRETGYAAYAERVCRPYVEAARTHFSPGRRTFTERWLVPRPRDSEPMASSSRGERKAPRR